MQRKLLALLASSQHWVILWDFTLKGTSHKIPAIDSVEIQLCSNEYLCNVIFSRPVAQKLFPYKVILVEYMPIFEPLQSKIDYLMQENDLYFAVEKCADCLSPSSVSFGVLSPRVNFKRWSAIVYCSNPVLYKSHFVHQLKQACKVIKGFFIFSCYQDQSLKAYGRRIMVTIEPIKIEEEFSNDSIHLYERSLLHQSHR